MGSRALIAFLADPDVLFPVWERDVLFTVVNRPTVETGRSSPPKSSMGRCV